jgi:hypothetical protein
VAKAKEKGLDTAATESAIQKAEEALSAAEAAVEEQAAKDYVMEFSDEAGLRLGASNAKTSLRADLRAVRQLVHTARQTVVTALKTAKTMYQTQNLGE